MSKYAGSALTLWFVNAAGTLNMGPDTRLFRLTPVQAVADISAAHDRDPYLVPLALDYALDWHGLAQSGTAGTAYAQRLKEGTPGTLYYWPSGSDTDEVQYIIPAFSLGVETHSVYSDVTTYDCAFKVTAEVITIANEPNVVGSTMYDAALTYDTALVYDSL